MQQYYAIDLPGKALYKKDFSVQIRKITPIEQKYILSLSQKQQKTNRDYVNFIKGLVQIDNPEVNFEDLFWYDVQYILYRIRFTTYEKYPIKLYFRCLEDDCDEQFTHELKIGDLIINTPDDLKNYTETVTLDNLGPTPIRCKIMQDDMVINDFCKLKKIPDNDYQMKMLLLDLCAISNGKSLDELYMLAQDGTITAEDIVNIEKWLTDNIWGVKEEIPVRCPKCGKESPREYSLSLEDFFSAI